MNDIVVFGFQQVLNFADDPWIDNWISTMYTGDKAFQPMDNHICWGFRWAQSCDLLHGDWCDRAMGHNVNVVAQPPELRSETIDMMLDAANTGRITIGQQTDL